jgi:uncharacterized protein with FMN-binding domain
MKQWLLRILNLALILCVLVNYQRCALARAAVVEEYNQQAAEAAALAAEYAAEEAEAEAASLYADGTYQGTGMGFGGEITVEVTVNEGVIAQVEILSAENEDDSYLEQAEEMLEKIIAAQSADVDTVSGATFSSQGIREAAANALEDAQ